MDLQELTGQESGAVIYDGKEAIVCNWSNIRGYPRYLVTGLIGLGEDIPEVTGEVVTGEAVADIMATVAICYDVNDDATVLSAGNCGGTLYRVSASMLVIAPEGWA